MSNNFVQVPPNSTGLKMQTFENTVSANTVEAEAVVLVHSDGTEAAVAAQPLQVSLANTATNATAVTVGQATGSNLHTVVDSGTVTTVSTVTTVGAVTAITNALPSGTNVIGHVIVDSGTVTAVTTVGAVTAITNALPAGTNALGVVSTKTALTPSSPTAASVGVTSAQAVASNATRKGLTLVNTSANTISLGFGVAAVLNSGITLSAQGGTFNMNEYSFYAGAINAIASGATSNLAIQEFST